MNRYALLRYERGLTRKDLAAGSGVPERTLRSLETGDVRPSAPTAKALADFYDLSITELLGIDDEKAAA